MLFVSFQDPGIVAFFHQLPAPRYMPPAPSNPAGVASASASMVSSPQGEGNSKCAKYLRFDLTMDLILLRQCWAHPQLFVRGSPDMQGQGIAEELGRDPPFQGVSKRDPIANSLNRSIRRFASSSTAMRNSSNSVLSR